ncbi:hypothetical protein PHYSODRAFT_433553, partial [Phytophthora sojae]
TDTDNWTPLMIASRNNRCDVVALLLARGAQINLKGPNGAMALYIACERGHFPVVQLLVQYDALIDVANNTGETPLMAATWNNHTKV